MLFTRTMFGWKHSGTTAAEMQKHSDAELMEQLGHIAALSAPRIVDDQDKHNEFENADQIAMDVVEGRGYIPPISALNQPYRHAALIDFHNQANMVIHGYSR